MAKFNMKDYENYIEEEKRQDKLQEKLKYRRYEEDDIHGCYSDYLLWQRQQEREQEIEQQRDYNDPYAYLDYDDFYSDDDDNFLSDLFQT